MLTRPEIEQVQQKAIGKVCWLEHLAANDGRLILWNEDGALATWWDAEHDQEEQAQAARLTAFINDEWRAKQRAAGLSE